MRLPRVRAGEIVKLDAGPFRESLPATATLRPPRLRQGIGDLLAGAAFAAAGAVLLGATWCLMPIGGVRHPAAGFWSALVVLGGVALPALGATTFLVTGLEQLAAAAFRRRPTVTLSVASPQPGGRLELRLRVPWHRERPAGWRATLVGSDGTARTTYLPFCGTSTATATLDVPPSDGELRLELAGPLWSPNGEAAAYTLILNPAVGRRT